MKFVHDRSTSLSLSAITVGALLGLAVDLGFTLLGSGLGLGAIEADPLGAVGSGTLVGLGIFTVTAMLVAFFVAGYVAARTSPALVKFDAVIHGLSAFSLASLVMVFMLGSSAALGVGGVLTRLGLSPVFVSLVAFSLLVVGAFASGLGAVVGLKGAMAAARKRVEPLTRIDDRAA